MGETVEGTVGQPQGTIELAVFRDEAGDLPAGQYQAAIYWDNQKQSQSGIVLADGTKLEVQGMPPLFNKAGEYPARVVVTEVADASQITLVAYDNIVAPSPPVVNLTSSITTNRVVPTQATDLNLYQFFGNEEVNVPIVVTNTGTAATKVSVKVQLFLSGAPPLASLTPLDLQDDDASPGGRCGASATIPVNNAVVPTSLIAGDPYYITAQVSYTDLTRANAKYPNSTATSSRTFEFLGTPTNTPKQPFANLFETSKTNPTAGKTYFNIVRDTLNGTSALGRRPRKPTPT